MVNRTFTSTTDENELARQMVEGAPKTMKHLARNGVYRDGCLTDTGEIVDQSSRGRISLVFDWEWASGKEDSNLGV